MKKISLGILLIIISLLPSCNSESEKQPMVKKGVLDLRNWDLNSKEVLTLEGEWQFYWNQFLYTDDFLNQTDYSPYYSKVPGTWNDFIINDKKLNSEGFATYRLKILLKEKYKYVSLNFLSIQTAYRVFIDGSEIASGGEPGRDRNESKPGYNPKSVLFSPSSLKMEIIIHVSNFDHRKGGLWGAISFGSIQAITQKNRALRDRDIFIIGAILIIGIYYLGLFFIRKQEREALFFSLYCMAISMRIFVTGDILLLEYLPGLPWKILIIIEYITFFSSIPLFLLFINSLFSSRRIQTVTNCVIITSLLFSILAIILPVRLSSYLIPVYQIITLMVGLYITYILILFSFRENQLARILLLGFLMMFVIVINDILYAADIINSKYIISYGLLIFIIFQSFVMTIRFAKSFHEVERQQKQLQKTNMEYRYEIDERIRLEEELHISYQKNAKTRLAIIIGLAKLAEYRDSDTGTHIERIQEFNTVLARQLKKNIKYKDYVSDEYIEDLHISSILHDIGKVGIPDSILQKPGKLTETEFEIMKMHSVIGGDSIRTVEQKTGVRSFLTLGRDIAYMHHEKWDGSGYPDGIKGEVIPLSARLTALADVYDALTSKRCYKDAFSHQKAFDIIVKSRGTHFDPDIVDAFIEVHDEFNRIRSSLLDEIVSS